MSKRFLYLDKHSHPPVYVFFVHDEDNMLNHIKVRDGDYVPNALDMFPCQISKKNRTKLQEINASYAN